MVKRLLDILLSSLALIILSPLFIIAVLGIWFSSSGLTIYRAERAGLNGKSFIMHKFRTMHIQNDGRASAITATNDARIFPFGTFLRKLKIDEIPQLFDVLRGEMSIVGPRPEDLAIVKKHYTHKQKHTLSVKPGLASPGSLYNYTHGHLFLSDKDPEKSYTERLLPIKLDLELVYVNNFSILYDIRLILRTIYTITLLLLGKKTFPDPPEMRAKDI